METKKSLCCGADMIIGGFHSTCLACMKNCFWQKNEDLTLAEVFAVKDDVISFMSDNHVYFNDSAFNTDWSNHTWLNLRFTITDRKSWHRHEKKLTEWPSTGDWFATIKIGDRLTVEQAQKYIEAGGFVQLNIIAANLIYKWDRKLKFYLQKHRRWEIAEFSLLTVDYYRGQTFTAVENPEKAEVSEVEELKNEIEGLTENLADEQIKVKELNENCHGLKKEVEDLKSQLEAERKKSKWLPYPENKPSGDRFVLLKDINGKLLIAFYYEEIDTFEYYHSLYKLDKSTIRFFREV